VASAAFLGSAFPERWALSDPFDVDQVRADAERPAEERG
jgi:hypothetical protein